MNQKNEIKREDMTYEEFLILCAKLKGSERKNIVNPIDSLIAKTELANKIIKKIDFFEFCINNFLEMHYPQSKIFCLEIIIEKFAYQNDISFDLYDILIQKFFIEWKSKLSDEAIGLIFKIQVHLFYMLYDLELWMQLLVCEDCCIYILNNPEYQVIGFINCLIDFIYYEDNMNDFIKKMAKDGVFDILIKYLFERTLSGLDMAMNTLCKIFELLDFSVISENEIFESFLNGLQEDPAKSIKFLSAFFSNGYRNKKISNEKKAEIIDFLEKNDIFNFFNEYLINQSSESNDTSTISQFSILIYTIFYPLIPQNFSEEDREANDFLIPIFEKFCPIFFQTLACLNEMQSDYFKFLYDLSLLLPDQKEDLLNILIDKLNVLLTNSQTDFNSSAYMVNYLNLYLSIQKNTENEKSEEEDENNVYFELFQRLETGIENLERTRSFLAVLGQIFNTDEYELTKLISNSDGFQSSQKVTQIPNSSNSKVTLIRSAVNYFEFVLNEDLNMDEVGESLYTELILLYSLITFKWTTACEREEWIDHILRIFTISLSHLLNFVGIVNHCVKLISEDIQKVDGIDSIVLNFLSSLNRNLTVCGLNIADQLSLSMQQKDDLIIEALKCIMQSVSESSQQIEFNDISPLFLSTSIESINFNRKVINGGSGNQIDPQIIIDIHDFMMSMRGEMDYDQINGWITAFLNFFGFNFFNDVRDIFEPILKELQSEVDFDFDFEKVTILAGELKKTVSTAVADKEGEFNDSIDFVTNILVMSAKKCELLIQEFAFDESDRIFIENGYFAQRHQNFLEAKDFANEAAEFFVALLSNTQMNEVYMEILSFFKMCCSLTIIKNELALFSIFQFVVENDQDSIDEFLECSFKLIHFIENNGGHSSILFAVARFHKLLIRLDKAKFMQMAKPEVTDSYLSVLFDTTIISDTAFNEKIKKIFYQKRFENA